MILTGNVLIIEDEKELAELVQAYLTKEGISATWAESAEMGLSLFLEKKFDLIILDINLPGMDGFEFLQYFRKKQNIPVIIVSAREADEDIILGLGVGADEFVTKPFAPRVLTARVRAHLRRNNLIQEETREIFAFGEFTLDYDSYILKKNDSPVAMSAKEFEVLRFLVKNAGTAYSPDDIYDSIWKQEFGDIMTVAVYIQRIRKKIDTERGTPSFIKTIHGKGYRFDEERLK